MRFAVVVLGLVACGGDGSITIELLKPATGDAFVRDQLGPTGAVSALIPVEVSVGGTPTRITSRPAARFGDLSTNRDRGHPTAACPLTGPLRRDEVASTASVDSRRSSAVRMRSADAFRATTPRATSLRRRSGAARSRSTRALPGRRRANPRTTMFATVASPIARARGAVVPRRDIQRSRYASTTIAASWRPPRTPDGISPHAYAIAIDLAGFTTTDPPSSAHDDCESTPMPRTRTMPTVGAGPRPPSDLQLKAADVWNIVCADYNADHVTTSNVDLRRRRLHRRKTTPVYVTCLHDRDREIAPLSCADRAPTHRAHLRVWCGDGRVLNHDGARCRCRPLARSSDRRLLLVRARARRAVPSAMTADEITASWSKRSSTSRRALLDSLAVLLARRVDWPAIHQRIQLPDPRARA